MTKQNNYTERNQKLISTSNEEFTQISKTPVGEYTPNNTNRNTNTLLFHIAAFYVDFSNILSPQSVKKLNSLDPPFDVRESLKSQSH